MKKIVSILLVISLLTGITSVLAGCQKSDGVLTRAGWIDMLSEQYNLYTAQSQEPYYKDVTTSNAHFQRIQSCAEWGIIEKSSKFNPNGKATTSFAIVTAIKAIGVERLEKSDYRPNLKTDNDIITFFKTQSGSDIAANKNLTIDLSREILEKTQAISDGMTLPQFHNIEYKSNVKLMNLNQVKFDADGKTARLNNGSVNVGDIIVIEPNEFFPDGKYAKITENNNGQLTYIAAEIDEVTDKFEVSGTYDPKILAVRPLTSGVTVVSAGGTPVAQSYNGTFKPVYMPLNTYNNAGKVEFGLNKTYSSSNGKITISGSVSVDFDKITVDFGDWIWLPWDGYRNAYLRIDDTVSLNISVEGNYEQTIPLAAVGMGIPGVSLTADLALNIGIDGSAYVTISVKTAEEVTIQAPSFKTKLNVSNSNPQATSHLEVHGWVRPDVCVSVKIIGHKIAYVGAYSGVEAKATVDNKISAGINESCIDLKAWVPLAVYYGYDLIIKKGDDKKVFWDEGNSVWKQQLHIEDGVVVPKCTRTGEETAAESDEGNEQDGTTADPSNIDDDLVNFSAQGGYLQISSYFVAMSPNETDSLVITRLPEGYSATNIVFVSENPSVATVNSGGAITIVGEGTAIIKVSTSDGEYEQFCAVVSRASYPNDYTSWENTPQIA